METALQVCPDRDVVLDAQSPLAGLVRPAGLRGRRRRSSARTASRTCRCADLARSDQVPIGGGGRVPFAFTGRVSGDVSPQGLRSCRRHVGGGRWAGLMSEIATPPVHRVSAAVSAARDGFAEGRGRAGCGRWVPIRPRGRWLRMEAHEAQTAALKARLLRARGVDRPARGERLEDGRELAGPPAPARPVARRTASASSPRSGRAPAGRVRHGQRPQVNLEQAHAVLRASTPCPRTSTRTWWSRPRST